MNLWVIQVFLVVFVLICHFSTVSSSAGDRSYIFQKCLARCKQVNCTNISEDEFMKGQPLHMQLTHWTCGDECTYTCMWKTVDAFQKDQSNVPQFYGKWPFVRVLGMQEPASVLFSIGNAIPHIIMIINFRKDVPSSAPLYWIIHIYSAVCVNAWTWSAIFHTRDYPFTEMMDYFFALSLVFCSMYCFITRVFGTDKLWKPIACLIPFLGLYFNHVYYMAFVKFDYGYNMKFTVSAGLVNTIGWIVWSYMNGSLPHAWKAAGTVISVTVISALELLDFPPLWWSFDAHSLWHLGTIPINFLWYSFFIEDCNFRMKKMKEEQMNNVIDTEKPKAD